jgi:type VI protein secretion system component Hcp
MRSIRVPFSALVLLCLMSQAAPTAFAGAVDLYIPSISGNDSPPGFAGAMRLDSVTVSPNGYAISKAVDGATSQIGSAVASGTPLGTTDLLLYNTTPPGAQPAAMIRFPHTFATSAQIGQNLIENDTFAASAPALLYMDVSGIVGTNGVPDHPNAIRVDSFSITNGSFSIVKPIDSASPQIAAALIAGTVLNSASLLVYDTSPAQQPDDAAVFHNVIVTASQLTAPGGTTEQDTFAFTTITPEPGAETLLIACVGAVVVRRRKLKGRV